MSKPKTPNRVRSSELVSLPVGDVIAIIDNWRSHYPEDIFPRNGNSPECKAAYMARHVCDGIASDVVRQANADISDRADKDGGS